MLMNYTSTIEGHLYKDNVGGCRYVYTAKVPAGHHYDIPHFVVYIIGHATIGADQLHNELGMTTMITNEPLYHVLKLGNRLDVLRWLQYGECYTNRLHGVPPIGMHVHLREIATSVMIDKAHS
jgi:hypothetical protein